MSKGFWYSQLVQKVFDIRSLCQKVYIIPILPIIMVADRQAIVSFI